MSRIAKLIEQVEAGEAIDLTRVHALQGLDLALLGEQYVAEAARRQQEADDVLERAIAGD